MNKTTMLHKLIIACALTLLSNTVTHAAADGVFEKFVAATIPDFDYVVIRRQGDEVTLINPSDIQKNDIRISRRGSIGVIMDVYKDDGTYRIFKKELTPEKKQTMLALRQRALTDAAIKKDQTLSSFEQTLKEFKDSGAKLIAIQTIGLGTCFEQALKQLEDTDAEIIAIQTTDFDAKK